MRLKHSLVGAGAGCLALFPLVAFAQTSTIAGTVKDTSGAVLPHVTVEASSPALIEKVRSATSDGSGQYKIVGLRPGTYTITFVLLGFSTAKQEGVELTSDFTAQINIELKVGPVELMTTASPGSPIVDVQGIAQRTVMTRDVLDAMPTGRNIQAVGILIPGTNLFVGGGGAISRDVGGSGGLQQSPLVYRGSIDAVQTIEGMRLNNLCANGAYSGVYWNDGSLQEISYVTGADSVEMGQGGVRINMVPRDGGNAFHTIVFGNYTQSGWAQSNLGANLHGDYTFNPSNVLTNGALIDRIWDFNPSSGGPLRKDTLWFYATFRHWGVSKTVPDAYFDLDPSPFKYTADTSRPGLDDGHLVSRSGRVTWQIGVKDKLSTYFDDQNKYKNHQGIAANVPPEATAIQVTPTSFVSVSKWTRTQTSKLLLDAGFAMYDQEFTERYRPEVQAFTPQQLYTILDNATGKFSNAAPGGSAEHFSKLLTQSASVSYVTGAHALRVGAAVTEGQWRLAQRFTGDIGQITYNAGLPANVILRLPVDRGNAIKADSAIFAQDRWTIKRLTVNAGLRYDWFIGETLPEDLPASQFGAGQHFGPCADGINSNVNQCTGRVQNWKDLNPRVGVAYDLFGTGKTALKATFARYVAAEAIGRADSANPETTLGLQDTRAWKDLDGNGSPLGANGLIQSNELTASPSTPTFGTNTNTTTTDPSVLNGWFKRGYSKEISVSVQHQLMSRVSVSAGYGRRWFGNQVFLQDARYSAASYDGPFCIAAPADPNLPGGGTYQVCGLYDLKPSLAGILPNSVIRFSSDVGGETNVGEGFDFTTQARFYRGTFVQGGLTMGKQTIDQCALNLLSVYNATTSTRTETFPNGDHYCHRVYPYRPDVKFLGSHTFPRSIIVSGTYQVSRGVQNPLEPSVLASWQAPNGTVIAPALGRSLSSGATTKQLQLIQAGTVYSTDFGGVNLNQLDLRVSKLFRVDRVRLRIDGDIYNAFNNNWPFTVNTTFSNIVTSAWLRPTNVLQGRFFKLGAQLEF